MKAILNIYHNAIVLDADLALELFKQITQSEVAKRLNYDYANGRRLEYFDDLDVSLEMLTEERYSMAKLNTAARTDE